MHDQQPFGGIGREQQPVTSRKANPAPDRGRQPQVPLAGNTEHAMTVPSPKR
jgi:hypothetical protein